MRPVTIRRFLVVGVCTVGVVGLYLAPSVARSPDPAGSGVPGDRPISRPSTTAKPAAAQSAGVAIPDAGTATSPAPGPADRTDEPAAAKTDEPADSTDESADSTNEPTGRSESKSQPQPQPSRSGATAFDPKEGDRDDTPPDPVGGIRFGRVTPTELTVRWAPAKDDTGVVGYRLWLDGFVVATTAGTEVTVKWFNDDMGQHVIQLKALDAAGNLSETAQSVLVARPTPEPSAEPTDSESEPPTDADKGKPEGKASEPAHKPSASQGNG